ncbi:hypothetical protein GPJ56_007500 [Histomonas meleagridis]|uniref:uncharacterized protein n=1 Tax=Histomonas meleagridis TaxID=135588 RepID=UPI00355AB80D|nr:hypothetical protein GPJ56_007500 [Histomonas meleagridis]KAH0804346.1 hypothetical protein GO595_003176 [Histomonas meleagridis]
MAENKVPLDLIQKGVELKKVETKEPSLPTAEEIAEQKKLAEQEGVQRLPEDLPKDAQNRNVHDLIKEGKELKKVETKESSRLPTAEEIAEQKKLAEQEGVQRLPEDLPRDGQNRNVHDLIKEGKELKKVETKESSRLPTAEEIAEQKKLAEQEGVQRLPEDLPRDGQNRTVYDLIKEGKPELKKVETKEPRLPTAEEIAEQKKLEGQQ